MSGPLEIVNPVKPARNSIDKDQNLCEFCKATCCRYFALPIDTPENYKEFDFIRWYILHEYATVFVEDNVWYLLVHTKCKFLGEDSRCQIYEKRPQICREYSTERCEYEDGYVYEQYFETPDQVEEYAEAVLGPRPGNTFRTQPCKNTGPLQGVKKR